MTDGKFGGWSSKRGQGKGIKFLRALLESAPPTCVTWPMFRDTNGYGRLGYNGRHVWAHVLMCEMIHGDRPTPNHEATHSCGKGKEGCVNPRHLLWGTRARNQLDRRHHGTKAVGGRRRPSKRKLTAENVEEIRRLRGQKTQRAIAAQFGVTDATIRDIYSGKSWAGRPMGWRELEPSEVNEIRKLSEYLSYSETAKIFDISRSSVQRILNGESYGDIAA